MAAKRHCNMLYVLHFFHFLFQVIAAQFLHDSHQSYQQKSSYKVCFFTIYRVSVNLSVTPIYLIHSNLSHSHLTPNSLTQSLTCLMHSLSLVHSHSLTHFTTNTSLTYSPQPNESPTHHVILRWYSFLMGDVYFQTPTRSWGAFQKHLWALKFSPVNKIHIFQCMGKIFCVEFQRYPLKFHTKYLTHTLKDMIFIQHWNFKSS